jgi:hypothetical protein
MARPKKDDPWVTLSVRLPTALIDEIDTFTVRLQEETPLLAVARADTIRYLLKLGLQTSTRKARR